MNGAEPTVISPVALFSSWLTPTFLFCFVNVVIGAIFVASSHKSQSKQQVGQAAAADDSAQLVRLPSFFDRVRSLTFRIYQSEQPDPFPQQTEISDPPDDVQNPMEDHMTSGDTPATGKPAVAANIEEEVVDGREEAAVRRRNWWRNETASYKEDEGVDAKADDFINRFRQQLKLQRIDSIMRYKQMLGRGLANR